MAKHQHDCHSSGTNSSSCSTNQLKFTEDYSSAKSSDVPKRIKEKVKMDCIELTALHCRRAFETVSGERYFLKWFHIFLC